MFGPYKTNISLGRLLLPFLPFMTLMLAVFCWPRGVQSVSRLLFNTVLYWSFNSSIFAFLAFCLIISFLLLIKIRKLSLSAKLISIVIIPCLLLEWFFLVVVADLAAMHTPLCYVPPPATYFPWRMASIFSIAGGGCLTFVLMHPRLRCEFLDSYDEEVPSLKGLKVHSAVLDRVTSVPVLLGLFHSTFYMESIVGTLGCNAIPIWLLSVAAIPWLAAASCSFIYQFRSMKLLALPYLLLYGLLAIETIIMNAPGSLRSNSIYMITIRHNQVLFDALTGGMLIILSFIPFMVIAMENLAKTSQE